MRALTLSLIYPLAAAAALLCAPLARAQAPAPATPAAAAAPAAPAALKGDQRIQHIHVEDSGSKVDEVRYGGHTQSVTVQPKGSQLPEYEVLSNDGSRARPLTLEGNNGPLGQRVWNVFKF
ncbi:MAG: hypothetical protein EKK45_22380 [Curvibacter sp.]|nr:MAG: hypothetical protein EKK45_22380 [Curvibacter sp.]